MIRIGLDAGGVLIDALMPSFPDRVAAVTGAEADVVRDLFVGPFRERYWTGLHDESAFWERIGVPVPDTATRHAAVGLSALIPPLRVAGWRDEAQVWIVSNHRHEWLEPVLAETGLAAAVDRVLVSSRTGLAKPDPAAWEALREGGVRPDHVLVVDDQQPNVAAARALGMMAIRADPGSAWPDQVDAWLAARTGGPTR